MTRTRALTFIVVFQLAAIGWLSWRVIDTASGVRHVAHEALSLATTIQSQRRETILSACQDQNRRHRNTVRELDRLLRRAERHEPPARRKVIQASRASTLLLIDALAPHRDCRVVVALTVGN